MLNTQSNGLWEEPIYEASEDVEKTKRGSTTTMILDSKLEPRPTQTKDNLVTPRLKLRDRAIIRDRVRVCVSQEDGNTHIQFSVFGSKRFGL